MEKGVALMQWCPLFSLTCAGWTVLRLPHGLDLAGGPDLVLGRCRPNPALGQGKSNLPACGGVGKQPSPNLAVQVDEGMEGVWPGPNPAIWRRGGETGHNPV